MRKPGWILFLTAIVLTSCGIEGYEPIVELKPPLALNATIVSNKIHLEFWGLNDEDYFSGFQVYVADTKQKLLDGQGNKIPNKDGLDNKPTIWEDIGPVYAATKYTFDMSRDYDDSDLIIGLDYFFYIKAYSEEKLIQSPPSNITNVTYTNI